MRLLLRLHCDSDLLPHNFNYPFSAAIYKFLQFGSPEFSEFLHQQGFRINGKAYKLFTFALRFNKPSYTKEGIKLIDKNCGLTISSPLIDEFVRNFVIGSFRRGQFEIWINKNLYIFNIDQMEAIPDPVLKNEQKFKPLSPLIATTVKNSNGKKSQHYFRYYDDINNIERVISNNLKNKYEAINNRHWEGADLKFRWDTEFIEYCLKNNKKPTVMETILKPGTPPVNMIGNISPFILEGDPVLMNVGYQAGFGEKNSMGFGLAQAVN